VANSLILKLGRK